MSSCVSRRALHGRETNVPSSASAYRRTGRATSAAPPRGAERPDHCRAERGDEVVRRLVAIKRLTTGDDQCFTVPDRSETDRRDGPETAKSSSGPTGMAGGALSARRIGDCGSSQLGRDIVRVDPVVRTLLIRRGEVRSIARELIAQPGDRAGASTGRAGMRCCTSSKTPRCGPARRARATPARRCGSSAPRAARTRRRLLEHERGDPTGGRVVRMPTPPNGFERRHVVSMEDHFITPPRCSRRSSACLRICRRA